MKAQVIVEKKTRRILCTHFCEGKKHDFSLFKDSNTHRIKFQEILADSGYQWIKNLHDNAQTPKKSSKKHPLTKQEKKDNHEISSERVLVENVIGSLKRYKILSERYRNRRKRFWLRFNLISAIHNFEL